MAGPVAKRSGPGRPPANMPIDEVRKLAQLQCTYEEIAHFFGVGLTTVKARARHDPEFRAALEDGKGQGLISLRRQMFRRALSGSDRMLIWLSKQHLGMRDVVEFQREGDPQSGVTASGLRKLRMLVGIEVNENGPAEDDGGNGHANGRGNGHAGATTDVIDITEGE